MAWVKAHAGRLIAIAETYGATGVCLCGSVARGTDGDGSDLDFYVRDFEDSSPQPSGRSGARQRADDLVAAFRELSPYPVDIRSLPGWPVDPPFAETMERDAIELAVLAERTSAT